MAEKLISYSGVLQVHTDHCGGMSLSNIVLSARATKVDFIVVTERNATEKSREIQGWHNKNNTLVVVDEEVIHRDGEFLALGGEHWVQDKKVVEQSIAAAQGANAKICGVNFQLQNGSSRQSFPSPIPTDWMDMICVWSFLDEYINRVTGDVALMFQKRPERILYGPRKEIIQHWDKLNQTKPTPAIGCVNAYNRKDPLLDWKEFFVFEDSFKTIRTMILSEKLSNNSNEAVKQVHQALSLGRSFVYNYSIGDAKDFSFIISHPDQRCYNLGDIIQHQSGARVEVSLPKTAEIVIRRNGEALFWGTGSKIDFPAPCPGVYRVEVYLDRRLWILTNPIYVTENQPQETPVTEDSAANEITDSVDFYT